MIGDRDTDVLCGQAAGTRTILTREGYPATRNPLVCHAEFEVDNLLAAAAIILSSE